MKDNDKITLTFGQLKTLVKESMFDEARTYELTFDNMEDPAPPYDDKYNEFLIKLTFQIIPTASQNEDGDIEYDEKLFNKLTRVVEPGLKEDLAEGLYEQLMEYFEDPEAYNDYYSK